MTVNSSPSRRFGLRMALATALASVALVLGATNGGFPATLPIAVAADPTVEPSPSASPLPTSVPSATPDPTVVPSDTPQPSAALTPTPDITPSADAIPPAPAATPSGVPTPSDAASPSAPEPTSVASETPTPAPTAEPLILYALTAGQRSGSAVAAPIPLYRLVLPSEQSLADPSSPHAPAGLASADCATCHAAHTASAGGLLAGSTATALCYQCHGTGSSLDVQSGFAAAPPNDAASDAYYSHPVTDASAAQHEVGGDTFAGVLDRHSVCADCHNPHAASSARPLQSTSGWTASGAIADAGGVAVTNGAAGSAPTYRLIQSGRGLTFEYELCLTCHSGATTLPARSSGNPSWWALDKGLEMNPANDSFHPIEAAGRNQTAQMAASLAGTSPFKAWTFSTDATIRCTSCHGDPGTVSQAAGAQPSQPAAGAVEASHASPNRGLLIAPYRDRALKPAGEAYAAGDFALCYLCHAERPFVDPNSTADSPDTLFPSHGAHLTKLAGPGGPGLSIDTPGDGAGYAICAECHFRIHSTAIAYASGDLEPTARPGGNTSLVGFAPNVTGAVGLAPTWTQPGGDGLGSCTLTCHGKVHDAATYTTAPGAGFVADRTSGALGSSGLSVAFSDATRYADPGSATWAWDFGDGAISAQQSPTHVYTTAGSFTVTLTVTRTAGGLSSTLTRTDYIVVTP